MEGVTGDVLAPSDTDRGIPSSREIVGGFTLRADAVVVTSGGIGADHDLVRAYWPKRLGAPPARMLSGVPDHVDGKMLEGDLPRRVPLQRPRRRPRRRRVAGRVADR